LDTGCFHIILTQPFKVLQLKKNQCGQSMSTESIYIYGLINTRYHYQGLVLGNLYRCVMFVQAGVFDQASESDYRQ
jgi:hypothetical protein